MNLSPYFEALHSAYSAEIDDLKTDSEGKNVLARRLTEKRSQFAELMPMIAFAPEMVAPAFHGGVRFDDPHAMTLLSSAEPEDFPEWDEIRQCVGFEPWADKLLPTVLAEPGAEHFLLTMVCLEFLHAKDNERGGLRFANKATAASEEDQHDEDQHADQGGLDDDEGLDGSSERRDEERGDGDDAPDLDQAGADWMAEQGFDRRG